MTDDPHEEPPAADDLAPDGLMTGEEQWWQFLDHETGQPEADGGASEGDEPGLELQDVSRPSHTDAGLSPTTRSFRCSNCRGDNPADLPFCVHCGTPPPRHLHERRDLLVLDTQVDETVLDYLADIFDDGAPELDAPAIRKTMEDPPAFLIVGGYPRQLDSLAERLRELDVDVRAIAPTDPQGAWRREVLESILRDPIQITLFAAVAAISIALAWYVSPWFAIPAAVAFWWLFRRRRQWYLETYRFEAEAVLTGLAGLDATLAARCRDLLGSLVGSPVRDYLSTCLMEYYALWHRLAPRNESTGVIGSQARSTARKLIEQVIRCCDDYTDVWLLLDSRQSDHLDDEQLARLRETEKTLRGQLARMARSLQKLRGRTIAATTTSRQAGSRVQLDGLADEVEDEIAIVGETLESLEGVEIP